LVQEAKVIRAPIQRLRGWEMTVHEKTKCIPDQIIPMDPLRAIDVGEPEPVEEWPPSIPRGVKTISRSRTRWVVQL
jgi:hypothetical protein